MSRSREQLALGQLSAVGEARGHRLQNERRVLAERERQLSQTLERQALDEALLAQQRAQWSATWHGHVERGGTVRDALALGRDRELLKEMAALLASRRAELQRQVEALRADVSAWAMRWRAAQAFDESLQDRAKALNRSQERAAERARDEEALMSHLSVGLVSVNRKTGS
jgi:hypothetical protein